MKSVDHPVAVVIPTYRRPQLLRSLLSVVQEHAAQVTSAVRIIVVDNDPGHSARTVATESGVEYVHEPRPGIAATRQAGLALAEPGELVVMIDDDVTPESGWLVELIAAWTTFQPTVLVGYVRYVWPDGTDPWIVAGGFMRRNHHATGSRLSSLSTGNVLIDADAVRRLGVDFDPGLGLSGGEDSAFGSAVLRAGGSIVASAESVVRDAVPVERTSRSFVRRRSIAHGEALVAMRLHGRSGFDAELARVRMAVGGVLRWVVFTASHLVGRVTSNTWRDADGMRRAWFAQGRIRAAFGRRDPEYDRAPEAGGGR